MINKILFLFLINLSFSLYGANLVVVDVDKIINTNTQYIDVLKKIEKSQNSYHANFKLEENKLDEMINEIENSKLILSEEEINTLINKYNQDLNKFTNLVDNFNKHYQSEIAIIRKILIQEIIVLLEKYAKNNQIDVILDSNSYLIASNSINITEIIQSKLNEINLILDFKDFENN